MVSASIADTTGSCIVDDRVMTEVFVSTFAEIRLLRARTMSFSLGERWKIFIESPSATSSSEVNSDFTPPMTVPGSDIIALHHGAEVSSSRY